MKNKKAAWAVIIFIIVFMLIAALLALGEHIPFIGKGLALIFAVICAVFVIIFFIIISKKKNDSR